MRWLVALAFTALATAAVADVAPRRMGVEWIEGVPHVSVSARDLATPKVVRKLKSGLPQTLVLRLYAYADRRSQPLALHPRSCRVAYDLWDEVYRVEREPRTATGDGRVEQLEDVLRLCLALRRVPVGTREVYEGRSGQQLYFAAIVEFNPMSRRTVERIRRWIARPSGSPALSGDAFFGSFVSLFVNRRIGEAERAVQFRSQWVDVP